ncbi:hypothetical protein IMZ08_07930 [Bacillus luteolus]|uniref:Endolytic transglycosylase MltG n=1 Tax=Litchfieldia luteola TaxID=682179 RepID=A0ABR9QHM1_9BACI|nr:hypothetical protein [Cytobacillus luteolus]MBE4907978.1 hypothetical protein [Cytobacillus luteolus]MBP1942760.1 hypothetical protein [Cytobacillus luteolus]
MTNSMLRGIAMGMIIATCLLSAVHFLTPQQGNKLTKEDLELYLANQDLVAIPQQEYEDLQTQDTNANKNDSVKPESEKKEEVVKDKEDESLKHFTLIIVSGMNSLEIANLLEDNQIISSGKEFDIYLTENELNTLIQIGTYDLSSDMSFQTIADIITK